MILNSNYLSQLKVQILDSDEGLPEGNDIENNTILLKKNDNGTVTKYIYDKPSNQWCTL